VPTYLNILAGGIGFTHAGGVDLALGLATSFQTKTPNPFSVPPDPFSVPRICLTAYRTVARVIVALLETPRSTGQMMCSLHVHSGVLDVVPIWHYNSI
jgi:hypothetical protein